MPLKISARQADLASLDVAMLAIALRKDAAVAGPLVNLDASLGQALTRTLQRRDFRGGRDELFHLVGGAKGPQRILLVGIGDAKDLPAALRRAAALASRQARAAGAASLAWYDGAIDGPSIEAAAVGLQLGAWEYAETKTPPPEEDRRANLDSATIIAGGEAAAAVTRAIAIGEGYALARRLAQMPGNLCTPEYLAQTGQEIAKRYAMKVTVLGRAEMEKEQMGSFLSVAQGTPQDPKLIVLEHRKGPAGGKPLALVGKGLCFDTGGISIKPAQGMEFMKFDMCGGAGVLGAMEIIGRLDLKVNVVGLVGATTNMPSGTAVKPGDVVRSQLGKYIEIINTDAEGRLVLADVLSYVRRFTPSAVVDAATLTGACVIALGHTATGVMGNDPKLVDEVIAAGARAGETGWHLPLFDEYKELIKSDVADIKNSGGRPAGALTAGMFLKEFTEEYPWVHLDVAGTAYSETDLTWLPKGPTGVPVGFFVEFVRGRAG